MKKWRIKVVEFGTDPSCAHNSAKERALAQFTEEELNRVYGEWEIVSVVRRGPGFVVFLKQEISQSQTSDHPYPPT